MPGLVQPLLAFAPPPQRLAEQSMRGTGSRGNNLRALRAISQGNLKNKRELYESYCQMHSDKDDRRSMPCFFLMALQKAGAADRFSNESRLTDRNNCV